MIDQIVTGGMFGLVFALIELVKLVVGKLNPKEDKLEIDVAKMSEDLEQVLK